MLALSPWVVRNVRFDESLGQLHGYDFDFCLQVREAGKKVVTADFQAIHHHKLELVSNRRPGSRRTCAWPRSGTGRMPGVGEAGGELEAARAAGRGRGRPRPARSRCPTQLKPDARERQLERALAETDREHQLAPHGAAAAASTPGAGAAAAGAVSPKRAADLVLRHDRLPLRDAGRSRSRDSRSATENALESSRRRRTASWRAARPWPEASTNWKWATARWSTRFASSRSSSGLRSQRLERPRRPLRRTARPRPHDAEPEEHRHDRQPQVVVRVDEVLDRGEDAVARTALAGAGAAVGQPAGPDPGDAREQSAALLDRLAALLGDQVGSK